MTQVHMIWNLTESLRMLELVLDFLRIYIKCLLAGRSTDACCLNESSENSNNMNRC